MTAADVPEIRVPDWQVPANVGAIVTCRSGGVSKPPYDSLNLALHVGDDPEAVLHNRELLRQQLDLAREWQWLEQVHGNKVARVSRAQAVITADGLITATPGVACCVLTADCLPVFFAAADGSEVAIAHAGWRGLAGGILASVVHQMTAPASQLQVWLGPAIGPCHFEVGPEVREAFLDAWAETIIACRIADCFQPVPGQPKFLADLFALARLQLRALGVTALGGGGECTFCQQDKFYSFRRAAHTGRLLSMIYLKQAP